MEDQKKLSQNFKKSVNGIVWNLKIPPKLNLSWSARGVGWGAGEEKTFIQNHYKSSH